MLRFHRKQRPHAKRPSPRQMSPEMGRNGAGGAISNAREKAAGHAATRTAPELKAVRVPKASAMKMVAAVAVRVASAVVQVSEDGTADSAGREAQNATGASALLKAAQKTANALKDVAPVEGVAGLEGAVLKDVAPADRAALKAVVPADRKALARTENGQKAASEDDAVLVARKVSVRKAGAVAVPEVNASGRMDPDRAADAAPKDGDVAIRNPTLAPIKPLRKPAGVTGRWKPCPPHRLFPALPKP